MHRQMGTWGWLGLLLFFVILPVETLAQRPPKDLGITGTWSGSWKGASAASFEVKIAKTTQGELTGELKATLNEEGTMTSQFSSVVLTGNHLTLKLTDEAAEIELVFEVQVKGAAWTGTYSLRGKGAEAERGTLTARKKRSPSAVR